MISQPLLSEHKEYRPGDVTDRCIHYYGSVAAATVNGDSNSSEAIFIITVSVKRWLELAPQVHVTAAAANAVTWDADYR